MYILKVLYTNRDIEVLKFKTLEGVKRAERSILKLQAPIVKGISINFIEN